MEQITVAARDLNVGDLIPFPLGENSMIHLSKLERVTVVGVDPQKDLVEVHSQIGGKNLIAVGLPGDTVIKVYREEGDNPHQQKPRRMLPIG